MNTADIIAQHVDIEPTQRDRIADMINHYVDVVHTNETETDVINELATLAGCWNIAYEITDVECQCEIPFTGMDPECIACHTDIDGDTTIIANHLAPVIQHTLTTT